MIRPKLGLRPRRENLKELY